MSINSENGLSNESTDRTDYIEMLKHTSKKWKIEFKKLNRELFNKNQKKEKVYDTEVEKLFENSKETICADDKMQIYEKDFEEIESLLKVIEGKQQQLKELNATLLETVIEDADKIMKSINLNEDEHL